jgi:hypothetical protein
MKNDKWEENGKGKRVRNICTQRNKKTKKDEIQ